MGVFALIYLFLALAGGRVLQENYSPERRVAESVVKVLKRLAANAMLVKAYVVAFTLLLSFVALFSALDSHMVLRFHFTRPEMFNIRAAGILGVAGALLVPRLSTIMSFSKLVALGLFTMVAAQGLILLADSPLLIQSALVMFVAGTMITIPSIIILVGGLGNKDRGPALTWYSFILFIGAGIGPIIANAANFCTVVAGLTALLSTGIAIALTIKVEAV